MKTRLRDSVPYWVGSCRGSPVWGFIEILSGNETTGTMPGFNVWGGVPESGVRVRSKVRLVSTQKIRWPGIAWDAPRGDSSRYIFRFRKIQCTNGGGSPPGFVSCGVELRRGRKKIAIGRRNSPLFTNAGIHFCHCPSAPSAPLQLEDDPGTRDARPPFLCEIAPDACPVISRTWKGLR